MRILQTKKMYLPALSVMAVVLLLLVLIGISTYRNLDREKRTALEFVHRQGIALLRSIEAGARAGMMMPMWHEDALGSLIEEISKNEDIAYIFIYNATGTVVHHSDGSKEGKPATWKPDLYGEYQVKGRVKELSDGSQVYELAKHFSPLLPSYEVTRPHGMMRPGHMSAPRIHNDAIVVLGLRMTAFEEARQADLRHALIMAAILLALGTGALFFVFVIQNYYLVDKTLKQTQDYTAQVVAHMASGLLSVDPRGKVVSYNRLALELLGLEEPKVIGMDLNEIIDFQATGIDETLTHSRTVVEREFAHHTPAGETIALSLSVTPILGDDGTCRAAVIILRDLREIKKLEEEVRRGEKLAAIGKLAAGVAHEIRNPLSSIRGFAHYLRHALAEKPHEQNYAEIMVKEVDRINKVVTDLLTFARPVEGEMVPTDVTALVEHTVRLVEADARARGIEVQRSVASDLPEMILDANQITQALLNLMLNSVQAIEEGGKLEVGAERDGDVDAQLLVWVEDDGSGIPRDHMDKIFDPFFTTKEKGTGLGLAIVHAIVENHHGEIKVESPPPEKNKGTRFTISIRSEGLLRNDAETR
jgi:two-component system sensor histidine kinase HydH